MDELETKGMTADEKIIHEAKECLAAAIDAESNDRSAAIDDIKFRHGDQWPAETQQSRDLEARPCLVINKLDSFIRQVTNNQRENRPSIRVHPVGFGADDKTAKVVQGLIRHIETISDAEHAYDNAFDYAVTSGWGYWRITHDYIDEKTFDQEIYIQPVPNPFTVYFDPQATLPDGSDAEWCLVSESITKEEFKRQYPKAEAQDLNILGAGDEDIDWSDKETLRIAEYWKVDRVADKLLKMQDGRTIYMSQLPKGIDPALIVDARDSYRRRVMWYKLTAFEVLEQKEWAGRYIPIVPCYGVEVIIDGKKRRFGMVRNAKDPQRMYNYWRTVETELNALAPKAPWIVAEGQLEGFESTWETANQRSYAYLQYKQTDNAGNPAPRPERQPFAGVPQGAISAALSAADDIKAVTGIFDASLGQAGHAEESGKAIVSRQKQSDISNFHFQDNLSRSIKHTGRIILDLIPKIYDTERIVRIIGEDGESETVAINQPQQGDDGIEKVLNDVRVGNYDITIDVGPGYQTKRLEAADMMVQLSQHVPQLWQLAGDVIVRNMDWPGSDIIADRLAATNPLSKIDDKSEIPPGVQMKMAQDEQTIQQLQQQLQAMGMDMKHGITAQSVKNDGEMARIQAIEQAKTAREQNAVHTHALVQEHLEGMKNAHEAAMRELEERAELRQTQLANLSREHVAEINGAVQLLLQKMQPPPALEKSVD